MKLVAFIGGKGSGKDTCAAIAKDAGLVAGKISFAGPLKRICSDVFNIPLELFEHPELKEEERLARSLSFDRIVAIAFGMRRYIPMTDQDVLDFVYGNIHHTGTSLITPRHVLQYVGTELIRDYDPTWHCKAAFSQYNLGMLGALWTFADPKDNTYAVTDCRFLNEYEFLNENHDTSFFYVERPEAQARLALATHESERQILDVKRLISPLNVIHNTSSLDFLKLQTMGVLK